MIRRKANVGKAPRKQIAINKSRNGIPLKALSMNPNSIEDYIEYFETPMITDKNNIFVVHFFTENDHINSSNSKVFPLTEKREMLNLNLTSEKPRKKGKELERRRAAEMIFATIQVSNYIWENKKREKRVSYSKALSLWDYKPNRHFNNINNLAISLRFNLWSLCRTLSLINKRGKLGKLMYSHLVYKEYINQIKSNIKLRIGKYYRQINKVKLTKHSIKLNESKKLKLILKMLNNNNFEVSRAKIFRELGSQNPSLEILLLNVKNVQAFRNPIKLGNDLRSTGLDFSTAKLLSNGNIQLKFENIEVKQRGFKYFKENHKTFIRIFGERFSMKETFNKRNFFTVLKLPSILTNEEIKKDLHNKVKRLGSSKGILMDMVMKTLDQKVFNKICEEKKMKIGSQFFRVVKRKKCQRFGHKAKVCISAPICRYCAKGHQSRDCKTKENLLCYYCKERHLCGSQSCNRRRELEIREINRKRSLPVGKQTKESQTVITGQNKTNLLVQLRSEEVKDTMLEAG